MEQQTVIVETPLVETPQKKIRKKRVKKELPGFWIERGKFVVSFP